MGKTALIAGSGRLPTLLATHMAQTGADYVVFQVDGFQMEDADSFAVEGFAIENLALLFDRLTDLGVTQVLFAGAVTRAKLNPSKLDPKTTALLPKILPALQQGDDATLRAVIGLFEEAGFAVVGANAVSPELIPPSGVLTETLPAEADQKDAARAAQIVTALGDADVGQGAVVAQGVCLATETLPGTNAMLAWVDAVAGACRPDPNGAKGVLLKAPKTAQDRRIDLPVIGPDTIDCVHRAGLAGVVIETGGVMIVDVAKAVARANALGVFIWVRDP